MSLRVLALAGVCLACSAFAADVAPVDVAPVAAGGTATDASKPARSAAKAHAAKSPSAKAAVDAPAKPKPPAHDPRAARILALGALGEVTLYAPTGPAKGLALFASGDGGWNLGVWDMAQNAASLGFWVAGFSTPAFLKTLEGGAGECSDAAGLLDHLGSTVRTELNLAQDLRPVLIGYSSGATIAYAALAQSGDQRFGGAITLGFCPDLIIHKPFCEGAGLSADKQTKPPYGVVFNTVAEVKQPWIVLQGEIDQVCNPAATANFVGQVRGGRIVSLPHVGHGYSVPKNWMPQYRQGLQDLVDGASPARVALGRH